MEYQHGGDIYSHQITLDYSTNINPLGMPQAVRQAMIAAMDHCIHYPDSQCQELRQALAENHRIPKEYIICSNGAADAIFQAIQAMCPKRTVILAPTFSEYRQALEVVKSDIWEFELREEDGFCLPVVRLIEELDESFDLLILCNPNNPTGLTVSGKEMRTVLGHCKNKGIRLMVDECFLDFTDREAELSLIPLCETYENLMVLKAFTKMYGMAGVRLGYLLCSDMDLLEQMQRYRQPWSVSTLAQAAGIAALGEKDYAKKTRQLIRQERKYLAEELRTLGFTIYESEVNYLLFRDVAWAEDRDLYERCLTHHLLLRWCGNYHGLDGCYYRVCIKNREENIKLLQILAAVLKERENLWQR